MWYKVGGFWIIVTTLVFGLVLLARSTSWDLVFETLIFVGCVVGVYGSILLGIYFIDYGVRLENEKANNQKQSLRELIEDYIDILDDREIYLIICGAEGKREGEQFDWREPINVHAEAVKKGTNEHYTIEQCRAVLVEECYRRFALSFAESLEQEGDV